MKCLRSVNELHWVARKPVFFRINLVIQRALTSRQCHHPEPCVHSFFLGHLKATLLVRWAQASTICQYPTKPSLFICCIYTFGNSILLSMVSLLLFGIFLMDCVKYWTAISSEMFFVAKMFFVMLHLNFVSSLPMPLASLSTPLNIKSHGPCCQVFLEMPGLIKLHKLFCVVISCPISGLHLVDGSTYLD